MSLPYYFDFSVKLKRWILPFLLQVVSHKLRYFEQQACNTRAQIQNRLIILKFVLSHASGFPAAVPSTRQGMHL